VSVIEKMLNEDFPAIIDILFWFISVKDVELAHILGMENQKANGRYLLVSEKRSAKELAHFLHKHYQNNKVPTKDMTGTIGTWLIYGMSYFRKRIHSRLRWSSL
jgi:nucleoside-diphosphate-sugar epimerase